MSCDDGEDVDREGDESEDESDCEENMWNVKQIVGERKKGKTLEYQVEWEGEEWAGQYTWEPAAAMENNIALKEYLAAKAPAKTKGKTKS